MLDDIFSLGKFRIVFAILLASIAFTQFGYIWYATIFDDVWQALINRTEEELIAMAVLRGFIQTVFTYLISAAQTLGLFLLIHIARAKSFWDYQIIAAIVSVMIAMPVLGNAVLFAGAPKTLWVLDFAHFILGYAGIAATLYIVLNFKRQKVQS
ncbi:DUF1761 domain-containing protein [Hellea sp.]|nr:DUF1761 domain-containing protein [Hellea sp.]